MPKRKDRNGGLALVRTVVEWQKAKARVDHVFWSAPLTPQNNSRLQALKRRRDQLERRIKRILREVAKRSQGAGRS